MVVFFLNLTMVVKGIYKDNKKKLYDCYFMWNLDLMQVCLLILGER